MKIPAAFPFVAAIALVPAVLLLTPRGFEAWQLLAAADDPVVLADQMVDRSLSAVRAAREIDTALNEGDVDLAESFVALARERAIPLDPAVVARLDAAKAGTAAALRSAGHFMRGLVTGEPNDLAEFVGTAAGDLFVFGDIRDALREGSRQARGEAADEFIFGLACAGLAITAGTYVTAGAAAPARIGLSFVKAARRTGHVSVRLAEWTGRTLRGAVDTAALRGLLSPAALLQPATAVRVVRDAVKVQKMDKLAALAGDVARLQRKAGTSAALDGMKLAESPRDMSRLARLAESKGAKTRAILKLGGRAAIALTVGVLQLASWLLWAAFALVGFCASVKRAAERFPQRRKTRRLRALALQLR